MEKREKIEKLAQDKDEAMLLARVYDRITLSAQRNIPAATCFLSPREQLLTQQLLRGTELHFFGGAAGTERNMCCWLPERLYIYRYFHGCLCYCPDIRIRSAGH